MHHDSHADVVIGTTPARSEFRRRSSIVRQAVRFVVLNVKILRLSRQHH